MNEIADGIFVETSFEGVNVAAIVTDDVLIYVDAPTFPRDARYWTTQIDRMYPGRIRFLILTDPCGDRILNSRWLQATAITHKRTAEEIFNYDRRYPQTLIDSLNQRNPALAKELSPSPVEKPSISFDTKITLKTGGYDVVLRALPGPTIGNIIVHIPELNFLFSGDLVVCSTFPPLSGMLSQDWLVSLAYIRDSDCSECIMVPGRGNVTDISSARAMAEFIEAMRKSVLTLVDEEEPISEIAQLSEEFLNYFPTIDLPESWLLEEITLGLERIYQEYQTSPAES